mgnify:CR=1 FL=1
MTDRDGMIDYLLDADFAYIMDFANGPEYLDSLLKFGNKGYFNMTDEELSMEYNQRKEMQND